MVPCALLIVQRAKPDQQQAQITSALCDLCLTNTIVIRVYFDLATIAARGACYTPYIKTTRHTECCEDMKGKLPMFRRKLTVLVAAVAIALLSAVPAFAGSTSVTDLRLAP